MSDPRKAFTLRMLSLLLVACALAGAPVAADWTPVQEQWYVVELGGARAGFMVSTLESDGGRFRSSMRMTITLGRGGESSTIEISGAFEETAGGEPLLIQTMQKMGMQPVESQWRFLGNTVVHTSRQGGRELVRETEAPEGEWLTPMGVHRYWLQRVAAGDKRISYFTIDGQSGLEPIEVNHTFLENGVYVFDGREIPVTVWQTRTSPPDVTGLEHYTAEGDKVYEEIAIPGLGRMVTRLVTKAQAQAGAGEPGPEILVRSFVEPSRSIPRARTATTATLRLRVDDGTIPELPSAAAQRVRVGDDDGIVILTIDINDNLPAAPADLLDSSYLESSAMVDAGDALIDTLAAGAVRDAGDDELARADALRAAVHRHVSEKGLGTAFATASETARTRTGDCSEHAVLLCAMLRAEEIPARVAVGLVYADVFLGHEDIFGWHMWTQALIDGRWVDLDATLGRRYHAAHVLTAVSSLAQGGIDATFASTIMLMGNLEIDVVDVGYE